MNDQIKIFKYNIKFDFQRAQIIILPKGAKIISCGWKKNKPCFWAIINENAKKEVRQFRIIGTGSYLYFEYKNFIGTCIDQKNQETWHIFEV